MRVWVRISLFAATAALLFAAHPAVAQDTITVWWGKGFYKSEDDALLKVVKKFEEKTGTKVELVISRWAGPHADDQAAILKQFENETGIHVRMDAIDYFQLRQKQTLNLSGKTGAYDLVWVQEVWLPEYVSSGYLLPLDNFVQDESLSS